MKTKPLPKYLLEVLQAVARNGGEDIDYALGCLPRTRAHTYMSRLKARGLAYTYVVGKKVEVWATKKGRELLATPTPPQGR